MGGCANCIHRRYVPQTVFTQLEVASTAVEAYEAFDQRRPGVGG